ncbi:ABC transporter ATP-binding protein [Falsiroseomonas stagni]|uniref:Oligopeptide transport system ATP-binding protein n=1 Tax=Falsiroseomonas stagni DSM 19981 TaxID=1123062 RepID=A0A1I4CGH4_9PROT|nr:ABC transporter ATP-binding protein [Falsiroseomonas stagni]SFK80314.1 oligopeptide transport system ATP-binding protein [Falsiroseomonas stagni DSM 19981]
MEAPPLLALRGLRVAFPSRRGLVRAVDGVDFDIAGGEVLALLGESGCGKSVTSLALMGLLPATARVEGEIVFQGRDLRAIDPAALRALRGDALAMVFQEPMSSLNPVLTVGRQVAEALVAHGRADRRAARARAIELFGEVGLSDPARRYDAYPHELSGGMCQRVMIAMAIACDPALLIADEPTTALDVTIQKQILALIEDLRRRRGTAVLLITHDLGVVAENADRVAVMYAGRIVETAPVRELFASPRHPYTRGLLDSMPDLDDEDAVLHAIPGQVPDLAALPPGCAFAARCPRASDRCLAEAPPLAAQAPARAARCWHPL